MTKINDIVLFFKELNLFMNKYEYEKLIINEKFQDEIKIYEFIFDNIKIEEYFSDTNIYKDWEVLLDFANEINIFDFLEKNYAFYSDSRIKIINEIYNIIYNFDPKQVIKIEDGMFENHVISITDQSLSLKYFDTYKSIESMDMYLIRLLRDDIVQYFSKIRILSEDIIAEHNLQCDDSLIFSWSSSFDFG